MTEEEISPVKIVQQEEEELPKEEEPEEKYLNLTEEFKEEVLEVFDMFDKEKDFTIEVTSLATLMRWLRFNPTEKELERNLA